MRYARNQRVLMTVERAVKTQTFRGGKSKWHAEVEHLHCNLINLSQTNADDKTRQESRSTWRIVFRPLPGIPIAYPDWRFRNEFNGKIFELNGNVRVLENRPGWNFVDCKEVVNSGSESEGSGS